MKHVSTFIGALLIASSACSSNNGDATGTPIPKDTGENQFDTDVDAAENPDTSVPEETTPETPEEESASETEMEVSGETSTETSVTETAMDTGPGPADAECTALATAMCDKEETCTPYFISDSVGIKATCVAREKIRCQAAIGAAGSTITAVSADACAKVLGSVSCYDNAVKNFPTACALFGTNDAGVACGLNSQCKSADCKLASGSVCGVCAARGALGDKCGTPKSDAGPADPSCMSGLACNSVTSKCETPANTGDKCDKAPCWPGASCNTASKKCVADATKEGDACSTDGATDPKCDTAFGLSCSGGTEGGKTCLKLLLGKSGDSCSGSKPCEGGLYCKSGGADAGSTCVPVLAEGATCTSAGCFSPARCIAMTCTLPNPSTCK